MIVFRVVSYTSLLFALFALESCSSVGPGFANHPVDCASGIPWADCLPGTAGYNNGGGRIHREDAQKQNNAITDQFKAAVEQYKLEMQSADLDTIRDKVELSRSTFDAAPPFEIAANDEFPTDVEKVAIAKWANLRDGHVALTNAIPNIPPNSNPNVIAFLQQEKAFSVEAGARVSELIVALYHAKLTYGEFAKKRYEIGKSAADSIRQYKEAALISDQQRQLQAQQLSQQQFQSNLNAWSIYMQSVNDRQPQTVHVDGNVRVKTNCTTQRYGNMVNTSCN